jgi:hypothetical protein
MTGENDLREVVDIYGFNLILRCIRSHANDCISTANLDNTLSDCSVQVLFNDTLEFPFYVVTGMATCLPDADPPRFEHPPHYHIIAPKY